MLNAWPRPKRAMPATKLHPQQELVVGQTLLRLINRSAADSGQYELAPDLIGGGQFFVLASLIAFTNAQARAGSRS